MAIEQTSPSSWLENHRGSLQVDDDLRSLDDPQEQAAFTQTVDAGGGESLGLLDSQLVVQGMHCAACADAVEAALLRQPGVVSAEVNAATRRVKVRWQGDRTQASEWAGAAARMGYRLLPADVALGQTETQKAQRKALWRLFVAGFCAMQVMMYSWPIYVAGPGTMEPDIEALLRWASWWLSLPVVLFASTPFFQSAWRDLRQGRIGMDFPVSVGIAVTFWVSTAATYAPEGPWGEDIWFDSLTMLVFFLLGGRYLEAKARAQTSGALDALMARLPESCERMDALGNWERVSVRRLREGDVVRVQAGQSFPGDGELQSDLATVDEALLTGEALPVERKKGDQVIAGSRNLQGAAQVRINAVGAQTRFAAIVALMERAMHERPRLAVLADRVAAPFLLGVLLLAFAVGLYWWSTDPSRALATAVAVLIVTCPCALSLATPAAMLSTTGMLAKRGVLVQRVQALEALTRVSHVVFDKTGTLTSDVLSLRDVRCRPGARCEEVLQHAADLAQGSAHPISRALVGAVADSAQGSGRAWVHWEEVAGAGIAAEDAEGQSWRLGSAAWCHAPEEAVPTELIQVCISDPAGWLATVSFEETLRSGAKKVVTELQARGLVVQLVSGDQSKAVQNLAQTLGIDAFIAGATPEGKTAHLAQLQQQGHQVLMVGDGLNDAPVLSQANVSVAMGTGAALAQSQADAIVQSAQLSEVSLLVEAAGQTLNVVRQNLIWALGYNAIAVPFAASGWMPPWLAGIGMAASSLVVVLNALRLRRIG